MPIYMNITGLDGESTASGHEGWFDVFSFSWGEANATSNNGGGGGAGKTSFSDFSILKSTGKSSTKLFHDGAQGKILPAVQFEVTHQSEGQEALLERYTLSDCIITSYQVSGDGGSVPVESISFNFAKIVFLQTFPGTVSAVGTETATWNLRTNSG